MSDDGEPPRHQPAPPASDDSAAARQGRADALRRLAQDATAQPTAPASAAPDGQPPAAPSSAPPASSIWRAGLASSVVSARPRRWRLLALASGVLLVAVVVGALALHSAAGGTLPGLAPGGALLPQQVAQVYLDADVPWARITLDGRAITPPVIGQQPPLTLSPGRHVIRWIAAPFEPQSCTLSIPASGDDTCQLAPSDVVALPRQPLAQLVFLRESLATLATPQQAALTRAIQAALLPSYTATAQPGEIYSIPPGTVGEKIASQPLRMTLGETLNADAAGMATGIANSCFVPFQETNNLCLLDGRDCSQLCTLPFAARAALPAPDPHAWYAFALSELTWRYATQSGQVLLSPTSWLPEDGFLSNQPPYAGQPVLLRLRRTGAQWSVQQVIGPALPRQLTLNDDGTAIPDDPACFEAYQVMANLYGLSSQTDLQSYSQARFISGPNPAEGCLAEMTVGTPGKAPAKGAPVAEYLDRFGEFYLVKSVDAPLLINYARSPSAIDAQVAQQLATYPGQTFTIPASVAATS